MALPLASFFVSFGAKGVESTGAALHGIKGAFVGMAASGVMASQEMERFSYAQSELSRTVGSVFKPVVDKATDALFRFNSKLSESGGMARIQEAMGKFADAAIRLFEAFEGEIFKGLDTGADLVELLVDGFSALVDWITELKSGTLGWVMALMDAMNPLKMTIDLVEKLVDLFKSGFDPEEFDRLQAERAAKKQDPDAKLSKLTPRGGGMEDFKATYQRIQQAMFKLGETDYAKNTADNTRRTAEGIERLNGAAPTKPLIGV